MTGPGAYFDCAAFRAFHTALIFAASLAFAAALMPRLVFFAGFTVAFFPLYFAQRAFAAATILALPAALSFRPLRTVDDPSAARSRFSSVWRD